MDSKELVDALPLWGLALFTLALVLTSLEGGFRLGRWQRSAREREKDTEGEAGAETPVGSMAGATLGLLAFMLAITYQTAESRYDTRRQVFLEEVNAIGTAWLRTDLLPEPQRSGCRELLVAYADTRLDAVRPGRLEAAIARSEELHGLLWAQAASVGQAQPGSIVAGLFIESLNEVIDVHTKRVTAALRSRIPVTIWLVLYTVAVLAMSAMGYHAGLSSRRRRPVAVLVLAAAFSAVILLIADLDRPREGMITVSQQAMQELRDGMGPASH